jgi:hypothetical protein
LSLKVVTNRTLLFHFLTSTREEYLINRLIYVYVAVRTVEARHNVIRRTQHAGCWRRATVTTGSEPVTGVPRGKHDLRSWLFTMSRKLMHTPRLGALRRVSAKFNNLAVRDSSVLGYYVVSMGKYLLTFRKKSSVLILSVAEDQSPLRHYAVSTGKQLPAFWRIAVTLYSTTLKRQDIFRNVGNYSPVDMA